MLRMLSELHYAICNNFDTMIEYLKGKVTQNYSDYLIVDVNGRNRLFEEIDNWTGKRGQAGKKVPKGFPRNF